LSHVKRLAFLGMAVVVLAACGGGHKGSSTTTGFTAADKAQITSAYQTFFSAKTPVSKKPALLQDGSKFAATISALANNPLAANLKAKVSKVTLEGANRAKVVYTIYLGSTPALKNQVGTAIKENGSWLVGYASLCKLLALEGSTPAACKSAGG